MPENDYQAILADLGVDTSASTGTPEQGTDTNTQPEAAKPESVKPETAPTNASGDDSIDDKTDPVDDTQRKTNEAFAAMRSENTKYKKFLQQIMKGANFQGDEAAFMETLTEASYKRQAQGSQVSPEVLKRMDTLEAQNQTLLDAQNRQLFSANLKNLQDSLKLKNEDLQEFVNLAVRENIDLTIPGTNFVTLYQGLFYDKLKARDIEAARQEWITQSNKANDAVTPQGKSGKTDPTPTNVNTMAEFNSLLQSMPTNK